MLTSSDYTALRATAVSAMAYRADVQRPAAPTTDGYNLAVPGSLLSHLADVACHWRLNTDREIGEQRGGGEVYVEDASEIWMPLGTDVLETDVVSSVRDPFGVTVATALGVRQLTITATHIVVRLERFRG